MSRFRSVTPRQMMERLKKKRIFLFTADDELTVEVESAIGRTDATFTVQKSVSGSDGDLQRDKRVFLIHTELERPRPKTLVEELYRQNESIGTHVLLITEATMIDAGTRTLLRLFNIRGYIPRCSLLDLLQSRLETVFDAGQPMRRQERIATSFSVAFEVMRVIKQKGTCTSFSAGGMFIQTARSPAKGKEVTVSFQLPNQRKAQILKGKVLYQTSVGFAIGFDVSAPNIFDALRKSK